ncbi:NAD(P)-binding protein [Wolfiporia cocos MD-104 SS10]|uniref:NAD(P)-binding protein n=1 Tax=Wolfiporia cocos (strain MD-104) TaxID=742152 RepID=A0A2H3JJK1_WOLCO|nr:NAD(P)-binding protein [Wolfiporia cocos MD-104 SS10]
MFSKSFTPDDLPDLTGKVIIVTGGNAGVGSAAVHHLARRGAKVYMAARNEQRAKTAIERLKVAGLSPGNGEVHWLPLDYSDPREVKKAAEDFMEKEQRLDVVVNSAALLLVPFQKSHDGIQDIVMVNYIGPFLFIRTLLPLLKRTAQSPNSDVRVVMLSSEGHAHAPMDARFRNIDDLNVEYKESRFQDYLRYNLTKFMGMLYVKELQRRFDTEGVPIVVLGVHPGVVNTEGVQAYAHSVGPILSPIYTFIANTFFTSPSKGAYSTAFAAAAPIVRTQAEEYRGAYIVPPGKIGKASRRVEDRELAKELWDTTERTLADIGL